MPDYYKQGDNFPINWCHMSGWVEGVKPKSFTNQSNIGEPHSLILHPTIIDQKKLGRMIIDYESFFNSCLMNY